MCGGPKDYLVALAHGDSSQMFDEVEEEICELEHEETTQRDLRRGRANVVSVCSRAHGIGVAEREDLAGRCGGAHGGRARTRRAGRRPWRA